MAFTVDECSAFDDKGGKCKKHGCKWKHLILFTHVYIIILLQIRKHKQDRDCSTERAQRNVCVVSIVVYYETGLVDVMWLCMKSR